MVGEIAEALGADTSGTAQPAETERLKGKLLSLCLDKVLDFEEVDAGPIDSSFVVHRFRLNWYDSPQRRRDGASRLKRPPSERVSTVRGIDYRITAVALNEIREALELTKTAQGWLDRWLVALGEQGLVSGETVGSSRDPASQAISITVSSLDPSTQPKYRALPPDKAPNPKWIPRSRAIEQLKPYIPTIETWDRGKKHSGPLSSAIRQYFRTENDSPQIDVSGLLAWAELNKDRITFIAPTMARVA